MVGPSAQVLVSVSAWPVGSITNGNRRVWERDVETLQLVPISGSLGPRPPHWLEIADSTTNTLPQILTGLHPNPISADTTWGHT